MAAGGLHFLVTAGPTREPVDPVRYLSNRSSGRMGFAVAQAALDRGHEVTLVTGPVCLAPPDRARVVRVTTAQEMFDAVADVLRGGGIDVAVFAAAVADYRPVSPASGKIRKSAGRLTLELERTPDILGNARNGFGFRGVLCGFAAETEDLVERAREKRAGKGCDLVVANRVGGPEEVFDAEDNRVTLVFADGERELPRMPKREVAEILVGVCADLVAKSGHERT